MVFLGKHGSSRNVTLLREFSSPRQNSIHFWCKSVWWFVALLCRWWFQHFGHVFFVLDLLLLLSLFTSAWLFFKRKIGAVKFALAQELFRLISFRCSVSLFPLLLSMFDISNIWLNVGLFVTSESLKIYSLVFWMIKREKPLSWMTLYHRCEPLFCIA